MKNKLLRIVLSPVIFIGLILFSAILSVSITIKFVKKGNFFKKQEEDYE